MVRLVQRRVLSAEQASELPLSGRESRSAPARPSPTLTRSIVPTGVADRAVRIPGPAASPATSAAAPANPIFRRPVRQFEPRRRLISNPQPLCCGPRSRGTRVWARVPSHTSTHSPQKAAFLPNRTNCPRVRQAVTGPTFSFLSFLNFLRNLDLIAISLLQGGIPSSVRRMARCLPRWGLPAVLLAAGLLAGACSGTESRPRSEAAVAAGRKLKP